MMIWFDSKNFGGFWRDCGHCTQSESAHAELFQQAALKEFDGFVDETVENTGSPPAQAAQDTAEASMDLNHTEDPRLMKKIEHERASAAQPEGRIW